MVAKATLAKYKIAWDKWVQYATDNNQLPMPATLNTLGRYLASHNAWPTMELSVCAINYFHNEAGFGRPCRHPKIKKLMKEFRKALPYDHTSRQGVVSTGRYGDKRNSAAERMRRKLLDEIHEAVMAGEPVPYRAKYTVLHSPTARSRKVTQIIRSKLPPGHNGTP